MKSEICSRKIPGGRLSSAFFFRICLTSSIKVHFSPDPSPLLIHYRPGFSPLLTRSRCSSALFFSAFAPGSQLGTVPISKKAAPSAYL